MKALWLAAMPAVFVFFWSTGFIGAKFGLPYTDPMTFLSLRFVLVVLGLGLLTIFTSTTWPDARGVGHAAVVGVLVHAVYLGGVFTSISHGVPAGISAMIVSLQPVLTAVVVGPLFGERLSIYQVGGFVLGVFGVALVLFGDTARFSPDAPGLSEPLLAASQYGAGAVSFSVIALFGITAGTLYQKRFCSSIDIKAGAVIQYSAAGAVTVALAVALEPLTIDWTPSFIFALGWLVIVLSFGATTLLMILIRMGAAARTASLFYLVPPTTALIAFLMFDETLGPLAFTGMLISVIGVALVMRGAATGRVRPDS